jgi:putative ABC transport system ATP-binding protein
MSAMPTSEPVLELRDVVKRYPGGVEALRGVSLRVEEGELCAIVGPSGSGKSTLLNVLGTLERVSGGLVRIAGADLAEASDAQLAALRARRIGFVFQSFHLIESESALENVADGLLYTGTPARRRRRAAAEALERVGLADRASHTAALLSGGERQRVAIARALVNEPRLLLADEPTGNLDSRRSRDTLALLRDICHERAIPALLATHDPDGVGFADRVCTLRDGRLRDTAVDTAAVETASPGL